MTPTKGTAQEADDVLRTVFGVGSAELEGVFEAAGPLSTPLFNRIVEVIDRSGAIELLANWEREDRKSPAGRTAAVPVRAALIVLFLNSLWGFGYSHTRMASTIAHRLTGRQRLQLGISGSGAGLAAWYPRTWRASFRLRTLINPWHCASLRKRLTGAEYTVALEQYDQAREERAHDLARKLVRASVELLPKSYLESYRGDIALDSTALFVSGRVNPSQQKGKPHRDHTSGDFQSGAYTRLDDHDGTGKARSKPAYELDTTVMIDTKEGAYEFPLITGIYLHHPGMLKVGPRDTVKQHFEFVNMIGLLVVDRAFNNLRSEHFQEHIRRMGFETVYDYRSNQLGAQGGIPGGEVIIVDGNAYVNRMREEVIMISRWHAEGRTDPQTKKPYTLETRDEIMAQRAPYRLKPHGKIDSEGHQRFTYPNPRGYLGWDPATGKLTRANPTGKVTMRLDDETIRHLQKYPWQSTDWFRAYGQRNQVEASNKTLKDQAASNIGDKAARPARGFAYTYLTAMVAVVSTNMRRIITGIKNCHRLKGSKPKLTRARRRFDSSGHRLTHSPQMHETTVDLPGLRT